MPYSEPLFSVLAYSHSIFECFSAECFSFHFTVHCVWCVWGTLFVSTLGDLRKWGVLSLSLRPHDTPSSRTTPEVTLIGVPPEIARAPLSGSVCFHRFFFGMGKPLNGPVVPCFLLVFLCTRVDSTVLLYSTSLSPFGLMIGSCSSSLRDGLLSFGTILPFLLRFFFLSSLVFQTLFSCHFDKAFFPLDWMDSRFRPYLFSSAFCDSSPLPRIFPFSFFFMTLIRLLFFCLPYLMN